MTRLRRTGKYTCRFMNSDTEKSFDTLEEAQTAAERYCGNARYAKPFPTGETYLYGPGDGTTSVMVQAEIEFVKE